jgi:hypothetical protein
MSDSVPPNFPPPKPRDSGKLSLPRRRRESPRPPMDDLDISAVARESINAIVAATHAPFSLDTSPAEAKLLEIERAFRQLELTLNERQRVIAEAEMRLEERERDLAEMEALLRAREQLLAASRKPAPQVGVSPEQKAALDELRAELERQEVTLQEAKQAVREREIFLDESETKLFEKVQAQQEKENELEQREEDLRARDRRLREREATYDPQAAAALKAEAEAAKKRDEFNE